MSDFEAYRLTAGDEARIRARLEDVVDGWRHAATHRRLPDVLGTGAAEALLRCGAGAIGCSTHDLRVVELDWIATVAAEIYKDHREWPVK